MKSFSILPLTLMASAGTLLAAVDYSLAGSEYFQNFDGLGQSGTPAWTDDSTVAGWDASIGGLTPSTYNTGDGSGSYQGRLISAGSDGSSDRALSYQQMSPSAGVNSIGVAFTNTTGDDLTSFSLSYNGEQWRYIGGESATVMAFEYQIFSAGTSGLTAASGWTSVSALDFTSPETGASSSAVDGYTDGSVFVSSSVSSFVWEDGEELMLRWSVSGLSSRAIVGVDDVSFSAVPKTSSFALTLGLASLAVIPVIRRHISQ